MTVKNSVVIGKIPRAKSQFEELFALQVRLDKLAPPIRELKFHATRRWRFDFAWPEFMFAVEVEGITYDPGRHQRKQGMEMDLRKYEAAMIDGWTVYRVSQQMVKEGTAIETTKRMLEAIKNGQ